MAAETATQTPGTVSQILWHFTGGPAWDNAAGKQSTTRKSAASAYNALVGILESKVLRVGAYKEVVKVRVEKVRTWDRKAKKYRIDHDVMQVLESPPVSCLADIPIMHLSYHAARYGQFAIGFHRDAALKAGFNPVFYTLHESNVIREIHKGFAQTKATTLKFLRLLFDEINALAAEAEVQEEIGVYVQAARGDADDIDTTLGMAKTSIEQFLAFVKTFEKDEFYSVYCEREWRSVTPFEFTFDDVAMIVVPHRTEGRNYFGPFVDSRAKALGLPRAVPVVPWETLLES
jgi:Putative abortive phage resistance protein AbiGi, antitoxin